MRGRHSKRVRWVLAAILGLASSLLAGGAAAGDTAQGEKAFRRLCSACHAPTPGVTRLGPTLHGVVGRRAGTVAGFSYSAAYAAGQVVWTPGVLDQYLKDPKTYMPGSRMNFVGIRNEAERADLVAYLETLN